MKASLVFVALLFLSIASSLLSQPVESSRIVFQGGGLVVFDASPIGEGYSMVVERDGDEVGNISLAGDRENPYFSDQWEGSQESAQYTYTILDPSEAVFETASFSINRRDVHGELHGFIHTITGTRINIYSVSLSGGSILNISPDGAASGIYFHDRPDFSSGFAGIYCREASTLNISGGTINIEETNTFTECPISMTESSGGLIEVLTVKAPIRINLDGASNVVIRDNRFEDNLYLNASQNAHDVTITNNIAPVESGTTEPDFSINLNLNNSTISENIFIGGIGGGFEISGDQNNIINNTFYDEPLQIWQGEDIIIQGNIFGLERQPGGSNGAADPISGLIFQGKGLQLLGNEYVRLDTYDDSTFNDTIAFELTLFEGAPYEIRDNRIKGKVETGLRIDSRLNDSQAFSLNIANNRFVGPLVSIDYVHSGEANLETQDIVGNTFGRLSDFDGVTGLRMDNVAVNFMDNLVQTRNGIQVLSESGSDASALITASNNFFTSETLFDFDNGGELTAVIETNNAIGLSKPVDTRDSSWEGTVEIVNNAFVDLQNRFSNETQLAVTPQNENQVFIWSREPTPGRSIANGPTLGGNFWDNAIVSPEDADRNGILDAPYNLFDSDDVIDHYPLAAAEGDSPVEGPEMIDVSKQAIECGDSGEFSLDFIINNDSQEEVTVYPPGDQLEGTGWSGLNGNSESVKIPPNSSSSYSLSYKLSDYEGRPLNSFELYHSETVHYEGQNLLVGLSGSQSLRENGSSGTRSPLRYQYYGSADFGNGWIWQQILGYIFSNPDFSPEFPWVYHQFHGWLWMVFPEDLGVPFSSHAGNEDCLSGLSGEQANEANTFYDPDLGWVQWNLNHYPYIYSYEENDYLYFQDGTTSPRWFYSYSSQEWKTDDEI